LLLAYPLYSLPVGLADSNSIIDGAVTSAILAAMTANCHTFMLEMFLFNLNDALFGIFATR